MTGTTVKCTECGAEIEISEALKHQMTEEITTSVRRQQAVEIEKARAKGMEEAKEKLSLDLQKANLDAEEERKNNKELREQMAELMQELRDTRTEAQNAKLEAQKTVNQEQEKIRLEARRQADEENKMKLAEKDKQLEAARKAQEELQRKLNTGSQQLQGEVLELDLEQALAAEFREDDIFPVDKGVKGADIKQVVKTPLGNDCGVILWEVKRTKSWTENWVQKLKDDLRETKANIPVIITEIMPKDVAGDIHFHNGIWVAKPSSALILATLLRRGLLDVAREKAVTKHRGTSADALYNFVTSHEFVQPIEAMVEVYFEMLSDVGRERAALEKAWAKRENQAKKLLGSTASIIGGMQGQIGSGAMIKVKGLDLLESGD